MIIIIQLCVTPDLIAWDHCRRGNVTCCVCLLVNNLHFRGDLLRHDGDVAVTQLHPQVVVLIQYHLLLADVTTSVAFIPERSPQTSHVWG